MTYDEQVALVGHKLAGSPNDWQLKVFALVLLLKPGELISYGNLARWANEKHGLQLRPRNTAWLRKHIYHILGTNGQGIQIPVHRVANEGDLKSTRDHAETQEINHAKRSAEGSLYHPVWLNK